jgi:hypothetical protein
MIKTNKILSLINETKASFRRGGLEAGQTVIIGKRPAKGHGREIVQLGVPVIDYRPDDENQRETRVEVVPGVLHDLFDHLFQHAIIPFKPDYCVVDFFNEGDYAHPHHFPSWYSMPLCTICLTSCDMVFDRIISGERGENRAPLKLSLITGSAKGAVCEDVFKSLVSSTPMSTAMEAHALIFSKNSGSQL